MMAERYDLIQTLSKRPFEELNFAPQKATPKKGRKQQKF